MHIFSLVYIIFFDPARIFNISPLIGNIELFKPDEKAMNFRTEGGPALPLPEYRLYPEINPGSSRSAVGSVILI
jgi:hypothetical protein